MKKSKTDLSFEVFGNAVQLSQYVVLAWVTIQL